MSELTRRNLERRRRFYELATRGDWDGCAGSLNRDFIVVESPPLPCGGRGRGDENRCRARNQRKYVDEGKYCDDLDCAGTIQRREKITWGTATVILPAKAVRAMKYPAPRRTVAGAA